MRQPNEFLFLSEFGKIDDGFLCDAAKPWNHTGQAFETMKFVRKAACVFLVLALLGGGLFHSQVKAALQEFTTQLGKFLGITEDLADYTEAPNSSVTQNGLTLTLKEVILDQNQLLFLLDTQFDSGSEPREISLSADVWMNGEKLNALEEYTSDWTGSQSEPQYMVRFSFDEEWKDSQAKIKAVFKACELQVDEETGSMSGAEIGQYEFSFHASKTALEDHTVSVPLDISVPIDNTHEIQFAKFVKNSVGSRIEGTASELPEGYMYYLEGTDSTGKEIRYRLSSLIDGRIVFVNEDNTWISSDAVWIKLQLCRQKLNQIKMAEDMGEGEEIVGEGAFEVNGEIDKIGGEFVAEWK